MNYEKPRIDENALGRVLAADLRDGLQLEQKQISPVFLYDELGGKLFSALCELPWYQIRRAEYALIQHHAKAIASALRGPVRLIELGSGNGDKIEPIVKALEHMQARVDLDLADVSMPALEEAMQRFSHARKVFARYHVGMYEACFDAALGGPATERRLVAFLGSNLGNFSRSAAEDFILELRQRMRPGDGILLGLDLVKPPEVLLQAYDDPIGVTAAFNRNILARINREFGADFDLPSFRHEARWNEEAQRIEMHLVSEHRQAVTIADLDLQFELSAGESIWTESSHKYTVEGADALLASAGFQIRERWVDTQSGFMNAVYWLPPLSLVDA
jgi:dimethylhistidine N-methyltransferase